MSKYLTVTPEMLELAANYPCPKWLPEKLVPAFEFAREAHKNQFRKYTGDPYIVHPLDVLSRFLGAISECSANIITKAIVEAELFPVLQACLLHDTVEDCGVSLTTIEKEFGQATAEAVFWVTDTLTSAQGNRQTRKRLESLRLAAAPVRVRCLKLCDIISNTTSIVENDPDFAVVYIREKAHLLSLLSQNLLNPSEIPGMTSLFYNLLSKATANTSVI